MTIATENTKMEWLTLRDVMTTIRFSKAMVYRMIKDGEFPAPIKVGFASRWLRHEVEAWMLKHQQAETV